MSLFLLRDEAGELPDAEAFDRAWKVVVSAVPEVVEHAIAGRDWHFRRLLNEYVQFNDDGGLFVMYMHDALMYVDIIVTDALAGGKHGLAFLPKDTVPAVADMLWIILHEMNAENTVWRSIRELDELSNGEANWRLTWHETFVGPARSIAEFVFDAMIEIYDDPEPDLSRCDFSLARHSVRHVLGLGPQD